MLVKLVVLECAEALQEYTNEITPVTGVNLKSGFSRLDTLQD